MVWCAIVIAVLLVFPAVGLAPHKKASTSDLATSI